MWFALRNHPMALLMPQSGRRPQHQKQTFAVQKGMSALPPKASPYSIISIAQAMLVCLW
jgi:hypothetical protein